jgi:hypothetical protein
LVIDEVRGVPDWLQWNGNMRLLDSKVVQFEALEEEFLTRVRENREVHGEDFINSAVTQLRNNQSMTPLERQKIEAALRALSKSRTWQEARRDDRRADSDLAVRRQDDFEAISNLVTRHRFLNKPVTMDWSFATLHALFYSEGVPHNVSVSGMEDSDSDSEWQLPAREEWENWESWGVMRLPHNEKNNDRSSMIAIWTIITGKQPTKADIHLFDYFWSLRTARIHIKPNNTVDDRNMRITQEDGAPPISPAAARRIHERLVEEYRPTLTGSSSSSGR